MNDFQRALNAFNFVLKQQIFFKISVELCRWELTTFSLEGPVMLCFHPATVMMMCVTEINTALKKLKVSEHLKIKENPLY